MAKRRSNTEGTIYKRSYGSWRAQILVNGTRLSFSASAQGECREWLTSMRDKQFHGFDLVAGKIPVENFLLEWLESIKSSRSSGTVENYSNVLKPVFPLIGHIAMGELRPDQIQRLFNNLIKAGKSKHGVKRVYKVIHVAFEDAVKLKIIDRNPADGTIPPKPISTEMLFFDENQVQTFLLAAQAIGDHYYPLYFLAIHTGMRQAELLGLKWEDVEWGRATISVNRQLLYQAGGKYEFRNPKSASGRRKILLGETALNVLRNHQENIGAQSKKERWNENDLVFPSIVGSPVNAPNLRRSFRKLLEITGLPRIRFHDLRHTAASLMLNNGIPILIASKRLGHAKPSITLDVYGHLIQNYQEEAAALMDELMTPLKITVAPKLHRRS